MLPAPSQRKVKVCVEVKPAVDSFMFRLHYRWTFLFYAVAVALSILYKAGEKDGRKIDCMVEESFDTFEDEDFKPFKDAVDHYCFINGVFTADLPHNASRALPHPGVGPMSPSGEGVKRTVHSYYQWVPFVLFLQGVMFYVPRFLWKRCEGSVFRDIVQKVSLRDYLGDNLHNYFKREERLEALSRYVSHTFHRHKAWAYKFFACEALNLAVVLATLFFTDWFLGGAFLSYGSSVFTAASQDARLDAISVAFPKVAKCSFRFYGPSGTIQLVDALCVMAINILNEKIYQFLSVWLTFLTVVTCVGLLFRILTFLPGFRYFYLKMYTKKSVHSHLKALLREASVSDWFLLVSFAKNMEQSVFSELVMSLHSKLLPIVATAPPVTKKHWS